MSDDLVDIKLHVEGDITITKELLDLPQSNDIISTQTIIETIGKLFKQEYDLINGRYLFLNEFCNKLTQKDQNGQSYLSKIKYLSQHLNNWYFQRQWLINKHIQLSVSNYLKQPMWVTILPSLKIFNCEKLFSTDVKNYHLVGQGNLFQEISAVNLLPGIYVYNFRDSDVRTIQFYYTSANSAGDIGDNETIYVNEFKPYTLYYIKLKNTSEETIPDENGLDIKYTYKCVVMMSGVDPNVGSDIEKYENLTRNQIYYEEYYVVGTQSVNDKYKKAYSGTAKVFNAIEREDINTAKDVDLPQQLYPQPTKYWMIHYTVKYWDENFINELRTGDAVEYLYSFDEADTSGEFTYIFKLSDIQYLKYSAVYTLVDKTTTAKLTLSLENITQQLPTAYSFNEIQVLENQVLENQVLENQE